jgi:hypothetical protein
MNNKIIEKIKSPLYIFVDEAGDMDFSAKGSKHYMFTFLVKQRPFKLHEAIANYRYDLLERNQQHNGRRLDIEAFHASDDNIYVKKELFKIIEGFSADDVKVYSYILEKPKVMPDKRKERDVFYIANLRYAIERLLDKLSLDKNIVIITDRLPLAKDKKAKVKALKMGVKDYLNRHALNCRHEIYHHCSASSANLQIVDYISWAIFRKYERADKSYYQKIKQYLIAEEVMTKDKTSSIG